MPGHHTNIIGYEIFSEIDNISESNGTAAADAIEVQLNITPNRPNNDKIQFNNSRPFGVAILTTSVAAGESADFDAVLTVDPATVRFGPAGAIPVNNRPLDVDHDGDLDLVFTFREIDTGLRCGVSDVTLTGETYVGRSNVGYGTLRVVGCGR